MKKFLLSLLLVAVLFAIAACGQAPSATPDSSPTPEVTATSAITPTPSIEIEPSPEVSATDDIETPQLTPKITMKPTVTPTPTFSLNPPVTPTPTFVLNPAMEGEVTVFSTKEDFHWAIQESKRQAAKGEEKRIDALDEVDLYVEIRAPKKELAAPRIEMTGGDVTLVYAAKDDDSKRELVLMWYRPPYEIESNYVENFKNRTPNPIEIKINGNPAVKDIVHWDFEPYNGQHVCNQYFWTQDGMNMFLKVPVWLLEKYPEEDFFNIQIVTVPKG